MKKLKFWFWFIIFLPFAFIFIILSIINYKFFWEKCWHNISYWLESKGIFEK